MGNPVRQHHRALVLGALRADGPSAKTEVSRRLGLSFPTVSAILADFESEGVVVPIGEGRSSGGRRPMLYGLRTDRVRSVGLNVDPDRILAVVSDLSGGLSARTETSIDFAGGADAFADALQQTVGALLTDIDQPDQLAGIGIAVPSTMHRSAKGRFAPPDHPRWSSVDLHAVLGARFHLPVVAENRAHAVAVGEYLFGAGRGHPDLLCLMLGSGLGGGILAGGRLFTGGDGGAGAVGRMVLSAGKEGGHRRPPTVSDKVSAVGIARAAVRRLQAAGRAELAGVPMDRVDLDLVVDQALAGDGDMVAVLREVGHVLGSVVATTLCVTDSTLVLLCGSTTRAGDLIVDPMRDMASRRYPFALPEIRRGRLGSMAGALGAAALVLTDLVRDVDAPTPESAPPSSHVPVAAP